MSGEGINSTPTTKKVKPLQNVIPGPDGFTSLMEDGHTSPPFLHQSGNNLLAELQRRAPDLFGDVEFSQGPVKSWERSAVKLLDNNGGIDIGKSVRISDIVRGRIVFDTPEQLAVIRSLLNDKKARDDLGIEYSKDRFSDPNENFYRDINMTVKLPNGHYSEIQINQRDMLASADFTHASYEQMDIIRKSNPNPLTGDAERQYHLLENYTRDVHLYGASRAPEGFDDLLSEQSQTELNNYVEMRQGETADYARGQAIQRGTQYDEILDGTRTPGVSFIEHAEPYGGMGYKKLAGMYGIVTPLPEVDTSNMRPQGVQWVGPTMPSRSTPEKPAGLVVVDEARFNETLQRQGVDRVEYEALHRNVYGNEIIIQPAPVPVPVDAPELIEAEAAAQARATTSAPDTPNTSGHITTPDTPSTAVGTVADAMGNMGKNSGLIGGCVFGVIAGGLTLFGGGSAEAAASATYASVVPYGETQLDVARGDMGAAAQSATVETASNAASIGGMAVGAVVGQILIPIPGVGAAVGAFVGGLGAGVVVGAATDFVLDHGAEIVNTTMGAVNTVGSAISGTADAVLDTFGNIWGGITSMFNGEADKIEPEAALVNTPNMRDTNRFLSEVSAEQAEGLSPEMQSLYELRSDFARFWGQFNDLVEQGSLGEIMRDMQSHVGENLRGSEPLLAQQDRQFTQRLQSGGNLAFG